MAADEVAGMLEPIQVSGAQLLYLPPYSPAFDPIEQAWSKIKQRLRSSKARVPEALAQAVAECYQCVYEIPTNGTTLLRRPPLLSLTNTLAVIRSCDQGLTFTPTARLSLLYDEFPVGKILGTVSP